MSLDCVTIYSHFDCVKIAYNTFLTPGCFLTKIAELVVGQKVWQSLGEKMAPHIHSFASESHCLELFALSCTLETKYYFLMNSWGANNNVSFGITEYGRTIGAVLSLMG